MFLKKTPSCYTVFLGSKAWLKSPWKGSGWKQLFVAYGFKQYTPFQSYSYWLALSSGVCSLYAKSLPLRKNLQHVDSSCGRKVNVHRVVKSSPSPFNFVLLPSVANAVKLSELPRPPSSLVKEVTLLLPWSGPPPSLITRSLFFLPLGLMPIVRCQLPFLHNLSVFWGFLCSQWLCPHFC